MTGQESCIHALNAARMVAGGGHFGGAAVLGRQQPAPASRSYSSRPNCSRTSRRPRCSAVAAARHVSHLDLTPLCQPRIVSFPPSFATSIIFLIPDAFIASWGVAASARNRPTMRQTRRTRHPMMGAHAQNEPGLRDDLLVRLCRAAASLLRQPLLRASEAMFLDVPGIPRLWRAII